jgi:hypothetical protein
MASLLCPFIVSTQTWWVYGQDEFQVNPPSRVCCLHLPLAKNDVHKFSPHFYNIKLELVYTNSVCFPFLFVFIFTEKYKYKSV